MKQAIIIGAAGYSGAQLTGLLLNHPEIEIVKLYGSSARGNKLAASRFDELFPKWRGCTDLTVQAMDLDEIINSDADAVFLATPHEVSHDIAPQLLDARLTVFDLSGAFRLADHRLYEQYYGFAHNHKTLLKKAVYGLPELNREYLPEADLIALPGCYPTSIILALSPLIEAGAIDITSTIIADSVSGVSGAGKSLTAKTHFCEVSLEPYGVFSHRHGPEINQYCSADIIFTPHLGAFDRGILSTMHMQIADGFDEERIRMLLKDKYQHEPFVRLLDENVWPKIAAVANTNYCDIALQVDEARSHLILVSALDNLLKGAAGQAVQCMNLRLGFCETLGLAKEAPCLIQ